MSSVGSDGPLSDLTKAHPKFPFWSTATVYDLVCESFLRLRDSDAVSREMGRVHGMRMEKSMVETLRREAAGEASACRNVALRRKWMWRHKAATTNNLVREYMFLVHGRDFMAAKQELGAEIESLLEQVAADRLLLAVNDALGRADIAWHAVLELVAYHQAGLRLLAMAEPLAEQEGITIEAYLTRVAQAVAAHDRRDRKRDVAAALECAAWWLGREANDMTTDDLTYLKSLIASNLVLR